MIRDVEVKGKLYAINTTPKGYMATVERYELHGDGPAWLQELTGQSHGRRVYYETSREETVGVALALGWAFSRSNAWKNLWEWARRA
jgi:hypothetical protein